MEDLPEVVDIIALLEYLSAHRFAMVVWYALIAVFVLRFGVAPVLRAIFRRNLKP